MDAYGKWRNDERRELNRIDPDKRWTSMHQKGKVKREERAGKGKSLIRHAINNR